MDQCQSDKDQQGHFTPQKGNYMHIHDTDLSLVSKSELHTIFFLLYIHKKDLSLLYKRQLCTWQGPFTPVQKSIMYMTRAFHSCPKGNYVHDKGLSLLSKRQLCTWQGLSLLSKRQLCRWQEPFTPVQKAIMYMKRAFHSCGKGNYVHVMAFIIIT